jgi:AraC-like DNA-binding protein
MSEKSTDHIYLQSVPRPVAAMAKSYPANYAGYLHSHERAQLLYAASGTMKLLSGGGCWIIPQQRAVWIPAGYPHQTGGIGPMEMRTLYIREDACPSVAPQQPRMLAVSTLLRELVLRATKMPIEYDEQGHDGNLITALLGEIDWTPLHPVSLPPLQDTRLRAIEAALMKSPGDTRTLEEWAKRIGSSARTLSRLFRQEAQISFQTWREQVRTFAALPLLADGRPLTEIADALGYETAWSFTAMFKRVTGILPSRYFDNA